MRDSISCPHCRRMLDVPEDHQDGEVRCPQCQKDFLIGASSGITAQAPPRSAPSLDVQPGIPPRKASRRSARYDEDEDADDDSDLHEEVRLSRGFKPGAGAT